uniref:NADH-ubiquinone oxidoreductase chain 4L n=1 Tax=Astrospartus mediterraneus TaxID=691888 RepID=D3H5X8_ASTMD|nr:NADH dehydrogenase subunit 4L [Astrospartus mediterraneus]CBH40152.1 NADH dehydrogenase subunit 4L [Astrospartus mediterraneus]
MNSILIIILFSNILATLSLFFNKKFLLSLLLSLELLLLNLIILNIILNLNNGNITFISFSILILTLSAIEASIGISLLTLINRNFNNSNINNLNILNN